MRSCYRGGSCPRIICMQHVESDVYTRGSLAPSKSSRYGFLFHHLWSVSCASHATPDPNDIIRRDKVAQPARHGLTRHLIVCVIVHAPADSRAFTSFPSFSNGKVMTRSAGRRNAPVVKTVINDGDTPYNDVCHIALQTCTCSVAINIAGGYSLKLPFPWIPLCGQTATGCAKGIFLIRVPIKNNVTGTIQSLRQFTGIFIMQEYRWRNQMAFV